MIAVVPSVTTASRIKRKLEQMGKHASVIQTPKKLSVSGCSYSIRIDSCDINLVKTIARDFGSHIKAIFEETRNKNYTRVE